MTIQDREQRQAIQAVMSAIADNLDALSDASMSGDEELELLGTGLTVLCACWKNPDLDDTAFEELLGTISAFNRVWCYHTGSNKLPAEYIGRTLRN